MLTDPLGAQQRVLEHVKCPVQPALDAVLLKPVESFQCTALYVLTDSPGADHGFVEHHGSNDVSRRDGRDCLDLKAGD